MRDSVSAQGPGDRETPPDRWIRRRKVWIPPVLALLLVGIDFSRPPADQWSARALLWSINAYQATLSPLMPGMGVHCRFTPTCSYYGEASIRKHGALKGTFLAAWRILRCGPWTDAGTYDPP